ncbi:MAG: adenylosuccinate synthase [Methanomassiliicoccales archaeon]|nr:adenylosuccinate synthase [Methanomassiliicoccales archaeon]
MPSIAVIGAQWGDEGKGKITDYEAGKADMVVRYQGGSNAGHTIKVGEEVFALHILPSGIVRKGVVNVIGNGVIVDLISLDREIADLESRGHSVEGLKISDRANIILNWHRLLDGAEERLRGKKGVGTTGKGIGPCYSDKIARSGIRMGDLLDRELLEERLDTVMPMKLKTMEMLEVRLAQNHDELLSELLAYGKKYSKIITDTSVLVNDALDSGKNVLFEGAQGTMLDIDHGTYPFVTSSNCVAGAICTGAGVGPKRVDEIMGVLKAYTTRVGAGPFPTELNDDTGKMLLTVGGEYGTTTGRARRCGWLDLLVVEHAARLNGLTQFAVTKLDVMNDMKKIKVAVAYDVDGKRLEHFPGNFKMLERAVPVYEEMDGWKGWKADETMEVVRGGYEALPKEMRQYISYIEKRSKVPVRIISIGKGREETIRR